MRPSFVNTRRKAHPRARACRFGSSRSRSRGLSSSESDHGARHSRLPRACDQPHLRTHRRLREATGSAPYDNEVVSNVNRAFAASTPCRVCARRWRRVGTPPGHRRDKPGESSDRIQPGRARCHELVAIVQRRTGRELENDAGRAVDRDIAISIGLLSAGVNALLGCGGQILLPHWSSRVSP